ncbi:MAG: hypothetical protein KC476_03510 [Cyanobacteria bacterium HKST-UBA06]|nr:hypothetical protein [Cyanobacteria bacterium HKST-UBA05]MCA9798316.1 hypothetical protein [Cyanobacteria bacterium HKST-UBA04]MCA9806999.1 hypothetical protein [Cyanobacteria bacterium HKST-UBA06]MCA9842159.1 hypothetical protein [Cyanobacteria bacterium HKST-UBA03]
MSLQLKEVQWLLAREVAGIETARDALVQLQVSSKKALQYLDQSNPVMAQGCVEQCFTTMMCVLHYLNIDIEQLVKREQRRQNQNKYGTMNRVIMVFADHAELRVEGELRGTFPLYTDEDAQDIQDIAQVFQCRIEYADHVQLTMFDAQAQFQAGATGQSKAS